LNDSSGRLTFRIGGIGGLRT